MARRGQPYLMEFAEDIHKDRHVHSHLNIRVLGFLDLLYFWVCGAWQANKCGWHLDGHNKASTKQIIQHSLNATLWGANSAVTEDGLLKVGFPDDPFRA